ncbi:MAG TPA: YraN family protein [Blastocatellia bacterium]
MRASAFNTRKSAGLEQTTAPHLALARAGEQSAVEYLKVREGYMIVARNFQVPLGRGLANKKITGEIDIVAYDGDVLVFVEVKTRSSYNIAPPEAAVTLAKQRQIARCARRYRRMMNVGSETYRYDVVSIVIDQAGIHIELLKNYFSDSVFQRGRFFRWENWP